MRISSMQSPKLRLILSSLCLLNACYVREVVKDPEQAATGPLIFALKDGRNIHAESWKIDSNTVVVLEGASEEYFKIPYSGSFSRDSVENVYRKRLSLSGKASPITVSAVVLAAIVTTYWLFLRNAHVPNPVPSRN